MDEELGGLRVSLSWLLRDTTAALRRLAMREVEIVTAIQDVSTVMQALARPYCQVPDCLRRAARVVEIDLPASWEASATYATMTVHAGFCLEHGQEVEHRVGALVEARGDLHNLLVIVEAAILAERRFRTAGVGA